MPECPECHEDVPTIGTDPLRFADHGDCPGWFARVDWMGDPKSEGRFTEPRDDCPHPERWHSDDADSTEHEVTYLVAAFVGALKPGLVVETGSAWGQTAYSIGNMLALGRYGGVLHTIEPDPVRAAATRERCSLLPVEVQEMPSSQYVPPGPVGFAWLDSLPQLRVPEFRHLYPYFTSGAVVGFHDTGTHKVGMREAIEELEAEGMFLPIHLNTPRGCTFGEVVK